MLRDVRIVAWPTNAAALVAIAIVATQPALAGPKNSLQIPRPVEPVYGNDQEKKAPKKRTSSRPAAPTTAGATTAGATAAGAGAAATTPKSDPATAGTPAPTPNSSPVTTGTTGTATTTATPPAGSSPAAPAAAAAPAAVPASDPIVAAARLKLAEPAFTSSADNKDDLTAMTAFYLERAGAAVWVDKDGFTAKAKTAIDEVRKSEDWGLPAAAFSLPSLAPGQPATDLLAEAEVKLGLTLLKYMRYARGGRFNPSSLSRIIDLVPPVKDPKAAYSELTATDAPEIYLRGLHPKHEQFERLRQALLKARGPAEPEAPVDEALKIKLPAGKTLKPGAEHADIALLRQRLKVPAESGGKDTLFDPKLAEALKAFQTAYGMTATGNLTNGTRSALNKEGQAKRPAGPTETIRRILVNMERWRWMPENLGSIYVWDNVPEFTARVVKRGDEIFKEKIIVGLPEWATPTFSADMQYIIFNPSWGVPDGIKQRELLPRLRSAGGFFFFGGGGGQVLRAYGLTAYRNGKEVDPDSVDWSSTDIRSYSFVQPPGGKNPLGIVKFRFPNRFDVYMHDTTQRELFAQSNRALSHGCMRVENPKRLAAILLGEDKGWSQEKVANAIASGGEYTLDKPIPVHVTYFTMMVDKNGRISTFGDIYGHDSRLAAALTGRPLPSEAPVETASSDDDYYASGSDEQPVQNGKKSKKPSSSGPASLAEAISGLLSN